MSELLMKKSRIHCSHSSHFVKCTCDHERYLHAGRDENEHCTVTRCRCESFAAKLGYTAEQLAHETIPVEGRDYQGQQYGRISQEKSFGRISQEKSFGRIKDGR